MPQGVLLRQSHLAVAGSVVSASSEDGITNAQPVADSGNTGYLRLRAAGLPLSATAFSATLQRGGIPNGYATVSTGTPGTAYRWKLTTDSSTQWRGHTENGFLTYARMAELATATADVPKAAEPRTLANENIGYVYVVNAATNYFRFKHKATRTATWTTVTIATGADPAYRPGWCVLVSGRLLAYCRTTTAHSR